jgi:serine O-acetyltransferase
MTSGPTRTQQLARLLDRCRLGPVESDNRRRLYAEVHRRHPKFVTAVLADAEIAVALRGDRTEFAGQLGIVVQALRLALVSDSFLGQICYRAKARCQALRLPIIPSLFHRLAVTLGQIAIGDPVMMEPGVYIPHGQVVIDGITEIRQGVALAPFVSIGLTSLQDRGPVLGEGATIGTGARILGPVTIGEGARVGANAVVVADVPPGVTVVGVPAKPLR